ncbi:MAG: hypothetical protein JHC38_10580, partial [Thiotrichales bacterium]|nr:hypothetical protein [Thiotrichales bacterium]
MTANNHYNMTQSWEAHAQFKEYLSAVNPKMPKIDVEAFLSDSYATGETRLIPFDLSQTLATDYAATTPNLYAGYLRVNADESFTTHFVATSQLFFVIRGRGNTEADQGNILWKAGDLFTLPATKTAQHFATEDAVLFWVNDAPLLSYLGVAPSEARFTPVLYTKERLSEALDKERAQGDATKRNRLGVLLSNPNFPKTMTLTHTL